MTSAILNNTVNFIGTVPLSIRQALGKLDKKSQSVLQSASKLGQGFSWPIGVLDLIKKDEGVEIEDDRLEKPLVIYPNEIKTPPKVFQVTAMRKLVSKDYGNLEAPTGSGKTLMSILAMKELQTTVLFVTHRVGLAKQAAQTIHTELGVIPGFIGEGDRTEGMKITVAVAQSIVNKPLSDRYGLLIVDECHRLPTKTMLDIVCQYSARHKYGMTATLPRKNKKGDLIKFILGTHKVTVSVEDALEILNIPVCVPVRLKGGTADKDFCRANCKIQKDCKSGKEMLDCEFFTGKMFTFLSGWVNQPGRNEVVCGHAMSLLESGHHSIAILTSRKAHAHAIAEILSGRGISITVCVGKLDKYALDEFAMFGGILVGTESLMGEGVDLPELSALLLASPAGGRTKVRQRAGRLMRGVGTKLLIDYIDDDCYSQRLWWSRSKTYRSMRFGFKRPEEVL
jgi:superfamily II DNA or RNA helicase